MKRDPFKKTTPVPRIRSTCEFARHVGLARSTVSRVLNRQPGLKSSTIERVERALRETGFAPNAHARFLRSRSSSTIGVCVKDFLTPPIIRKMATLQQVLRTRGYSCIIEMLEPKSSESVIQHFLSLRVDGLAFIGYYDQGEPDNDLSNLVHHGTPHVVMDQFGIPDAHTVTLDRGLAMELAIDHLAAFGHRQFGLIGLPLRVTGPFDRLTGIMRALARHGLNPGEALASRDQYHPRTDDYVFGAAVARDFAALPDRPTAYLALNDDIAIGAMSGFNAAGLKVPRDVSIIGFNNQDVCRLPSPELTSIDQQTEKTVNLAVDILLSQIDKPPAPAPIIRTVEPVLVVRGSTGPAKR